MKQFNKGVLRVSRDILTMNYVDPINFDTIHIPTLPEYNVEDYDFYDDNDVQKYIKDVERICRSSFEYHRMVKFLRTNLDMNKCSFYENVTNHMGGADVFKIKIHIHHDPFTLYEIVKIVFNKRFSLHENLDEQITAKEVMLLHYNLMVGLIPLAETVHELVHNQYLFIPTDAVFGFYQEFMEMYDPWIEEDLKAKIDRLEEATQAYNGADKFILDTHLLYTDVSGQYKLPKYEDVERFLRQRIFDIDNGRQPIPHENVQQVNNDNPKKLIPCPYKIILD